MDLILLNQLAMKKIYLFYSLQNFRKKILLKLKKEYEGLKCNLKSNNFLIFINSFTYNQMLCVIKNPQVIII